MTNIKNIGLSLGNVLECEPNNIISGTPTAKIWNEYSSKDQQFHVGIWTSTPGLWHVSYQESELCIILSGTVRLTSQDGKTKEYKAGSNFVIPSGFVGTWETVDTVKKIYAIYDPIIQSTDA